MRKTIALTALLFAGLVRADEASDRADIENAIRALNRATSEAEARQLFTAGAFTEFERLLPSSPWSETSRPYFRPQAIRFVSPDVALVDASGIQYGSLILMGRAALFVMKKERNAWLIASIRTILI